MSSFRDCRDVSSSPGSKFTYYLFVTTVALIWRSIHVTADCSAMEVLEKGGINCTLINDIVKAHNDLRESVAKGLVKNQPAASDMREMYWDEELAKGAQDWANQCTFAHNLDKDREVARFKVGQSLARTKSKPGRPSTEKEFRRHITTWFEEHEKFTFGPIRKLEDLVPIGHYTQIVWASTYLVGCGYIRYKSNDVTYRLYVCHYGPTGNELLKEPYETGRQLKCPKRLIQSKKYPKLCRLKKSPPNPCKAKRDRNTNKEGKRKRKPTANANNVKGRVERPENLPPTRKFLSPIIPSITQADKREYGDKDRGNKSDVTPIVNKVFNIFFNFQ